MAGTNYIQYQLAYWAQVAAAATGGNVTYSAQNGPTALTGAQAASVYNITMGANFTIPLNRRLICITVNSAAVGDSVQYNEAASAADTVVCLGGAFGGGAKDVAFQIAIYRVELLP